MATGDGSPTSGGSGDEILTIDTFTDTATGQSGVKIAVGGIRKVLFGQDLGDVGPANELDVHDARQAALVVRQALSLRAALEMLIGRLESPLTTVSRSAKSVKTFSVTATTSSTKLLEGASGRLSVLVYNDATSSGNLYLSFGSDPAGSGAGLKSVRIVAGGYYEVPTGMTELPLVGIWDSSSAGFADVTEAY